MAFFDFLKKNNKKPHLSKDEPSKTLEEKKSELQAKYGAKLAEKKSRKTSSQYQKVIVDDSLKNLEIPKPHVMNIKPAGVTFENRQDLLKKYIIKKNLLTKDWILNLSVLILMEN